MANAGENIAGALGRLLAPSRVLIYDSSDKEDMLNGLVDSFQDTPEVTDLQALRRGIFQREEMMSTGIGLGIGVPHVRIASVRDLVMALGICRNGIADYVSLDDDPVEIVCMIAGHEDQHPQYIRTLAQVSERLKDDAVHDALVQANSGQEAYQIFVEGVD